MADHPAHGETGTARSGSREQGWGSPLPSGYGSLRRTRSTDKSANRAPSWEDWSVNSRRSPTSASAAYRSVGTSARGGRRGGLLRDLAGSLLRPPKQTPQAPFSLQQDSAAAGRLAEPGVAAAPSQVVTHVDVYSVARVSIVFYLVLLVVFVVASFLLWLVADAFGAVDSIQKSIRSLFDLKSFSLHPITIALYASAAGAVLAVAGTIANVLAAAVYNLISEVVGGIRIAISPGRDTAP